jgi:hypothetical protein
MNERSTLAKLFGRLSPKRLNDKDGGDRIPILKIFEREFGSVETLTIEIVVVVTDCYLVSFL